VVTGGAEAVQAFFVIVEPRLCDGGQFGDRVGDWGEIHDEPRE
jgi:hypothetical protein